MENLKDFFEKIKTDGEIEKAFSILLDFADISSISLKNGVIRKSTFADEDQSRVNAWEAINALRYTEEEVNQFFSELQRVSNKHFGGKKGIEIGDSALVFRPSGNREFICWKKRL